MPRKSAPPNPNQGTFFVSGDLVAGEAINPELDRALGNDNSYIGPHNNIIERGNALAAAIDGLGEASLLSGLLSFSDTTRGQRNLKARYGDVDKLIGNTEVKKEAIIAQSKEDFAKASGHYALLREAGNDPTKIAAVQQDTRSMHREFIKKYADPKGRKKRAKFKQKLTKQQGIYGGKSRGA